MKAVLPLILTFCLNTPAYAFDVYGTDSNYIEVTENDAKDSVGFRFCSLKGAFKCRQIGEQAFYLKSDLRKLQASEKWDVLSAVGADLLIVLGTAATGGTLAYSATAAGSLGATLYGTFGGIAAGATTGMVVAAAVDAINPREQYLQVETLDSDVINDERVDLDYDVRSFSKRLAAVLDNL